MVGKSFSIFLFRCDIYIVGECRVAFFFITFLSNIDFGLISDIYMWHYIEAYGMIVLYR